MALFSPPAEATPGTAPVTVQAESVDAISAIVTWTPGTVVAEEYRVYGIHEDGTPQLLTVVDGVPVEEFLASVEAGYTTYAVSGVSGGVESRLVYAGEAGTDCVMVDYDPLVVFYNLDCVWDLTSKLPDGVIRVRP